MGESASKHMRQDIQELDDYDRKTAVEYEKAFKNRGMSSLNKKVEEDMDKWRNVPVNIAVTGNAGVGKSSFINSFRGLKANSLGAAAVGVNETTKEPTKYMHPELNNIALWDFPGINTHTFPKERFLEKIDLKMYDLYLIVTSTRLTENDIWLAKAVQYLKKKFFFIRTKMNIDVYNEICDNPESSESDIVYKVREKMTRQVVEQHFENVRVYLIDNQFLHDYDFPILVENIIKEAPMLKMEPVKIAVTGNSGVGKSSFINSLRRLKADSVGAAAVGVNEMTKEPTEYMHPEINNVALWDLPGMGTQKFPKETYLEKVDFKKYDFFLIITATRFTENDIWLAKEVQKLKKKFFFIRTKMNIDVENYKYDYPGTNKSDTVYKVREEITRQVAEEHFKNVQIFLIDNRFDLDYDFPILRETMIKIAPILKTEQWR